VICWAGPDCRGMVRDVDVKQFAALVAQHHEDEQETEGQGWHEEEVDADAVSGMRGQKHAPGWGGPRCRPVHALGDGQLGDLVAKQGQFRLDAPAPPGGILASHAPDELAKLGVEPGAADRVRPGLPPPVELEASAVPRSHGAGRTMTRVVRQPAQRRDSQTQTMRSQRDRRGRPTDRWRTRS
jgi:hypothetical protein